MFGQREHPPLGQVILGVNRIGGVLMYSDKGRVRFVLDVGQGLSLISHLLGEHIGRVTGFFHREGDLTSVRD